MGVPLFLTRVVAAHGCEKAASHTYGRGHGSLLHLVCILLFFASWQHR